MFFFFFGTYFLCLGLSVPVALKACQSAKMVPSLFVAFGHAHALLISAIKFNDLEAIDFYFLFFYDHK